MKRHYIFGFLLLALMVPGVAISQAQAPVPSPTRAGKVFITGENPGIRLQDKQDGANLTQVSYWRIHWSPVGQGHVCYVTVGEANTPGQIRVAIHDNERLFKYLTNEILGTFNKSYVERPFTSVGGATFRSTSSTPGQYRELCTSDKYKVELVWHDLGTPELVDILPNTRPQNPFGLTYLRIPAKRGEILINGKPAPGSSYPAQAGAQPTAFLAFGETWLK